MKVYKENSKPISNEATDYKHLVTFFGHLGLLICHNLSNNLKSRQTFDLFN